MSGNAIASLQQIDDSVLRPTLTAVEAGLVKTSEAFLKIFDRFYTIPRMIRATGQKGWEIVEDFKGEMVGENFSASVSLMTGLSNNLVLRHEQLYKAHKEQAITTDELRVQLEFGRKEDLYEKIQKQDEVAQRRIRLLTDFPENYIQAPPTPENQTGWQCKTPYHDFDNHKVLFEALTDYMQENYDDIEEQAVKDTLKAHRRYHGEALKMMAMPIPGTVPGKEGKGGQPSQAPSKGLPDSVHSAEEQPDRDLVSQPGNSGLTAV